MPFTFERAMRLPFHVSDHAPAPDGSASLAAWEAADRAVFNPLLEALGAGWEYVGPCNVYRERDGVRLMLKMDVRPRESKARLVGVAQPKGMGDWLLSKIGFEGPEVRARGEELERQVDDTLAALALRTELPV